MRVDGYIKDYGLEYYFETGTGQAEAFATCCQHPFKNVTPWILMRTWWSIHTTNLKDESTCDIEFLRTSGKSTDISG